MAQNIKGKGKSHSEQKPKQSHSHSQEKIVLEVLGKAHVTTAIQFPYEQLPRRQAWQFIYFNLTDSEIASPRPGRRPSHCVAETALAERVSGGTAVLSANCTPEHADTNTPWRCARDTHPKEVYKCTSQITSESSFVWKGMCVCVCVCVERE